MNIFEGGRRLAMICYAIIAIVGALVLMGGNPYLNKYYRIQDKPGLLPVDNCGDEAWFETKVEGKPDWATVSICGFSTGPKSIDWKETQLPDFDQALLHKSAHQRPRRSTGKLTA